MSDPVVVGGMGGSGTRVVAMAMKELGIAIGTDLNSALDNRHFTALLKRPVWLRRHWHDDAAIDRRLAVLGRLGRGERLSPDDRRLIREAIADMFAHGHNAEGAGRGLWALGRGWSMLAGPKARTGTNGWGWKEPNSHLVMHRLDAVFSRPKYIHLMRNGYDMALSSNQQQFENWGSLFDVEPDGPQMPRPVAAFRYWLRANRRALEIGTAMGDRFLALKYEDFVDRPDETMTRLVGFLGLPCPKDVFARLVDLPRRPESIGRAAGVSFDGITRAERDMARALGYVQPDPLA